MDLDELIATAAPRTQEVKVCGRGDLAEKHVLLSQELRSALLDPAERSLGGNQLAIDISQQIADVEQEMEGVTMTFVISAVSRTTWANLLAAHPPTREHRNQGENINPITFPVAAVAACCLSPKMDQAKASVLADTIPPGEWQKLWNATVALNTVETTVPKLGAATAILQANAQSSTTSDLEALPEARSLGGSGEASPGTTTETTDD